MQFRVENRNQCGNRFLFAIDVQGGRMSIHLKTVLYKAPLLSMALGLLGFTIALAASGDLDTTFSGDGLVTTNFGLAPGRSDVARSIAVQSNGKILAAGHSGSDFAVARYNINGSLDTTFSGDGRVTTNFGASEEISDIALQSNGKIVVVGRKCIAGECDVALARYNVNGTLDTTFSGDGKVVTDFGEGDNGSYGGLEIQSDGKILVVGYASNSTDNDFAIYRYNSNGTLDTTFSENGIAVGNFGLDRFDEARDLAIQSDGKIVVVGNSDNGSFSNSDFAIARLNANGTADMTFSGDGRQTTDFGGLEILYSVALQSNGKIVVAGFKNQEGLYYFAVARYNTNGSLDTTFNGTGRKAFNILGFDSLAFAVIVRPDGKIVVLGATNGDFGLVRLNSNGSFDTTFSGDGKILVDFGGEEWASALALQPSDGKYVLGGYASFDGVQYDFALARVLP